MKIEDIKIGMTVVAHSKSVGRQDSTLLESLQQGFPAFVVRKDSEGMVSLSLNPTHNYGEHFLASDLDAVTPIVCRHEIHDIIVQLEQVWRNHKDWLNTTVEGRKLISDLCEVDSRLSSLELEKQ